MCLRSQIHKSWRAPGKHLFAPRKRPPDPAAVTLRPAVSSIGYDRKTHRSPASNRSPPQRASLLTKVFYRVAKRRFGEVPEPFAVAAHHPPRLMMANVVHEGMLQSASKKLPKNVLEIAVFWTARTVGCSWCVDFGSMLQRLDGLDVDRLKHIDDYATPPPLFSDDERAAIAYADAVTSDPHTITDEQVDDLKRRFATTASSS